MHWKFFPKASGTTVENSPSLFEKGGKHADRIEFSKKGFSVSVYVGANGYELEIPAPYSRIDPLSPEVIGREVVVGNAGNVM
jgi:hypothetical protein